MLETWDGTMTDRDHTEGTASCTVVTGSARRRAIAAPPGHTALSDEPHRNDIVEPEGGCNPAAMASVLSCRGRPRTEMPSFTNGAQRGASQGQGHGERQGLSVHRRQQVPVERVAGYYEDERSGVNFGVMTDESDDQLRSQADGVLSWGQGQGRGRSRYRRSAGQPRRSNRDDSPMHCNRKLRMHSSMKVGDAVGNDDEDTDADEGDEVVLVRPNRHLRSDQPCRTDRHHQPTKGGDYEKFSDGDEQRSTVVNKDSGFEGQSSLGRRHQPLTQCLERRDSSDQLHQSRHFTKRSEVKKQSEPRGYEIYEGNSVNLETRDEAVAQCLGRLSGSGYLRRAVQAGDDADYAVSRSCHHDVNQRHRSVPVRREASDKRGTDWSCEDERDSSEISRSSSVEGKTSQTLRHQPLTQCLERRDSAEEYHRVAEYRFVCSHRYEENRERLESDFMDDDEPSSSQHESETSTGGHQRSRTATTSSE